ncbi:hypothetical protein SAMN06296386_10757 [Lachnospiraceae bacterium]|nr:hypothetical protein SAMN06296386_10757 [Lachnospiraceae bacterium]
MKSSVFQNKKILFICRETYSKPLWFLARDLAQDNKVGAFYIMSSESHFAKCYYNEHTIWEFRENLPECKLYDVSDICDKFVEGIERFRNAGGIDAAGHGKRSRTLLDRPIDPSVKGPADLDFLKDIERDYTHFKTLGLQLMSSQENTKHYHWREYWPVTSDEENQYWLELNYKKIFAVLDDFQPDVILDLDNAELQRTILCEVAWKRKIPYLTIEYGKYGYWKYPSFQNSFGIDPYFRKIYEEKLRLSDSEMQESLDYIKDFREKSDIMNPEFAGSVTTQYERDSWIWILRVMRGKWNYFMDQDRKGNNRALKKKSNMLYAKTWPYLKYYWNAMKRKRKFLVPNGLFEVPVEGEDYVYMPLHLIPESSVFVKASYYVDELNLIEQVSKSLPVGWKLYVKEHQAMLGERDPEFYRKAGEIANVRVVQINHYKDPKPWIAKAKGVVTITGTAAYEAALLGKRSIVFGDVPFSIIDGVTRIRSYEDLPEAIRSFGSIDNIHSAAAYLEAVKEAGAEVKIFELMDGAEDIFAGKTKETPEFDEMLQELLYFYEKGYQRWLNGEIRDDVPKDGGRNE